MWVTLHNLLDPTMNLHGAIPMDALCTPAIDPDLIKVDGVDKTLVQEEAARLEKLGAITIAEFCAAAPDWAEAVEWSFIPNKGCLTNWTHGKEFKTVKAVNLDLVPWLREQSDEVVKKLAIYGCYGCPEESLHVGDNWVDVKKAKALYELLERTPDAVFL